MGLFVWREEQLSPAGRVCVCEPRSIFNLSQFKNAPFALKWSVFSFLWRVQVRVTQTPEGRLSA